MASFDLNSINAALGTAKNQTSGVDFTGKSLKLDSEDDGKSSDPLYFSRISTANS